MDGASTVEGDGKVEAHLVIKAPGTSPTPDGDQVIRHDNFTELNVLQGKCSVVIVLNTSSTQRTVVDLDRDIYF